MIVCLLSHTNRMDPPRPLGRGSCAGETAWSVWCNNPLTARRLGLLLTLAGTVGLRGDWCSMKFICFLRTTTVLYLWSATAHFIDWLSTMVSCVQFLSSVSILELVLGLYENLCRMSRLCADRHWLNNLLIELTGLWNLIRKIGSMS